MRQYLFHSSLVGPTYYTKDGVHLVFHIDAAFGVHVDGSSHSSAIATIGRYNSHISLISRPQEDIALSPCCAEYYCVSDGMIDLLDEIHLLDEIDFLQGTIIVYEDSLPAIGLVYSPVVT